MTANRKTRKRLDEAMVALGLAPALPKAQAMIMAGEILINHEPAKKAGQLVKDEDQIELKDSSPKYVSRGGKKLAGALDHFQIDPKGLNCLDVGASTGGFTDCLLQRGAAHVFTIDVGRGQLDPKIRNHSKVTWKESFHVHKLSEETLPHPIDLAVVDVSFTSLTKVIPYVLPSLNDGGILLALIKPQFEVAARDLAQGGVVKEESKRQEVLIKISDLAQSKWKLNNVQLSDAVIKGPNGNQETFLYATS